MRKIIYFVIFLILLCLPCENIHAEELFPQKEKYIIVIDPGHGGSDAGAVGNNMLEKDYNLLISQYMFDRFKELGIPVAITRNSDVTLSPTDRTNSILSKFGNSSDVIVISNHVNAGGGEGAEVIYALRNNDTLAKNVLNNIGATGQSTRKYYQRRLPSDTSKDYYFIHRNTGRTEPIIVEYGFIDNADDVNFLNNNYQALAEAVISAVANYAGVPYTSPEGITTNTYTVQRGDTLYSIAAKLGTTVQELTSLNNLTSSNLSIGQVLRIPTKEIQENEENIYIVKPGDSLYAIARDNNTTVDEIKSLNNLTSNTLSIGQLLKLPSALIPEDTYTVQRGDSLYSIARTYGVTVDDLKRVNNLTSNTLSIGQVLNIPGNNNTNVGNTGNYPIKKCKLPKEVTDFLGELSIEFDESRFEISADKLYYIPKSFPAVKGLRILRCGLYVGEIKKNRFEPGQSLAMYITKDSFKNTLDLKVEDERVIKYLKGETIDAEVSNGWCLVCVDSYPLGWGKVNNGTLKNKYLPGWRLMS